MSREIEFYTTRNREIYPLRRKYILLKVEANNVMRRHEFQIHTSLTNFWA